MKRLITLFYSVMLGVTTLMAQTNHTFEFVDAAGKTIADGSTVTISKVETDPIEMEYMPSGVFVRNVSGSVQHVILSGEVKDMKGGTLEVCFSSSCQFWDEVKNYETEAAELPANMSQGKSLEAKFSLEEGSKGKSHCTVKMQLFTAKEESGEWVKDKPGPSITLVFDKTTTGIGSVSVGKIVSYNVYNLQGRLIGKNMSSLQGLSKGTYLVQKINDKGVTKTEKYIVQ